MSWIVAAFDDAISIGLPLNCIAFSEELSSPRLFGFGNKEYSHITSTFVLPFYVRMALSVGAPDSIQLP
jgi:hypothetical protein